MLTQVATSPKSFEDYRPLVGDEAIDEIYQLVEPLRGARMLHINATARGGGVAEILTSLVPLMNDIGIPTEWHVMEGSGEFYQVTKALHNSLQGMQMEWTPEMWATWELYNQRTAELMEGDYDFVVVHDPQPAGVLHYLKEAGSVSDGSKWTWRCHIDTTNAQQEAWSLLLPYLHDYGTAIFTLKQFVKRDLAGPRIRVIPPAIDPLSEKNVPASGDTIRQVLTRFNVDPDRPFMLQASRMDAWKDPIGVLESYHIIKPSIPSLQLVFLVAIADDDPEGWAYLDQVKASAGSDPDVHILARHRERHRQSGGKRIPDRSAGGTAEVTPRGLWPSGVRGALEGPPGRGRKGGWHPAPGTPRQRRATWSVRRRSAPSGRSTCYRTRRRRTDLECREGSLCGRSF